MREVVVVYPSSQPGSWRTLLCVSVFIPKKHLSSILRKMLLTQRKLLGFDSRHSLTHAECRTEDPLGNPVWGSGIEKCS